MGTWSATISGNDYFLDVEAKVVEVCGLDLFLYLEDNSILTAELFNDHFLKIVDIALKVDEHSGPLALGVLILKFGANLPSDTKEVIMNEINRELDLWDYPDPRYKIVRHAELREFRDKIQNYKIGDKITIKEESLIGLSFKREFLIPLLQKMKNYRAPVKYLHLLELLISDLKTPIEILSTKLELPSRSEFLKFISDFEGFGIKIKKKGKKKENRGFAIIFFAQLFKEHILNGKVIEKVWIQKANLPHLYDQPELGEEYGVYGLVYKLSLFGKVYVGKCTISIYKRIAQHLAKFQVSPQNL